MILLPLTLKCMSYKVCITITACTYLSMYLFLFGRRKWPSVYYWIVTYTLLNNSLLLCAWDNPLFSNRLSICFSCHILMAHIYKTHCGFSPPSIYTCVFLWPNHNDLWEENFSSVIYSEFLGQVVSLYCSLGYT